MQTGGRPEGIRPPQEGPSLVRMALVAGLLLLAAACSREAPAPERSSRRPAPVAAAAPEIPQPAAAVEPRFTYQPEGRRDPFRSLLDTRLVEEGGEGIDYSSLKVAGIVWQRQSYVALVETADGLGHILRVNDPLGKTGRVQQISPEGVVIEVRARDFSGRVQTRTITLELKKEDQKP